MAIHEDIRDAVVTAVRTLDLVPDARVYGQETPDTGLCDLPAVICTYDSVVPAGGSNERDDFKYGILCGLYGRGKPNSDSRAGPDPVAFQDAIRVLFNNKASSLAGVTNVYNVETQQVPVPLEERPPQFELLVSAVLVVATARVPRS